jgi:hypothetical protein
MNNGIVKKREKKKRERRRRRTKRGRKRRTKVEASLGFFLEISLHNCNFGGQHNKRLLDTLKDRRYEK